VPLVSASVSRCLIHLDSLLQHTAARLSVLIVRSTASLPSAAALVALNFCTRSWSLPPAIQFNHHLKPFPAATNSSLCFQSVLCEPAPTSARLPFPYRLWHPASHELGTTSSAPLRRARHLAYFIRPHTDRTLAHSSASRPHESRAALLISALLVHRRLVVALLPCCRPRDVASRRGRSDPSYRASRDLPTSRTPCCTTADPASPLLPHRRLAAGGNAGTV